MKIEQRWIEEERVGVQVEGAGNQRTGGDIVLGVSPGACTPEGGFHPDAGA